MTNDNGLAERLDLDSWIGENRLDGELFLRGFRFFGDELSGFKLARGREMPTVEEVMARTWIWVGPESTEVVSVTTLEAPSRDAAHRALARLLTDFQSLNVDRLEETTVGDVAFGDGSGGWVAFARANLALLIRNGGDDIVNVFEFVGPRIDELILRRDEPERDREPAPRITELAVSEAEDRERLLTLEVVDPLDRPVTVKLFTRNGQIERRAGELFFVAEPGEGELVVVAVNANRGVATRRLTVEGR